MEVYGEHERTCQKLLARFKSGDFGSEGGESSGRPKNEGGPNGVTQAAIKKHLKAAGYIQKQGNRVPYKETMKDGFAYQKEVGFVSDCDW